MSEPTAAARPRPSRAVILVLGAGAGLQALYLVTYLKSPFLTFPLADAALYDGWAREIVSGHLLRARPFHMAPLYAYALAALYALTGPTLAAAAVVQSALFVLNGGLVVAITRSLAGRNAFAGGAFAGGAAAWGAVLYLLHAPFAFYAVKAETVTIALTLVLLTLWLLLHERAAAAGVLAGLSCLARPELLLFLPLAAAWVGLGGPGGHGEPPAAGPSRPRARRLLAFSICAVAGILPATLHNLAAGELVPISWSGGEVFLQGNACGSTGTIRRLPGLSGDPLRQEAESLRAASQALGRPATAREAQRHWLRLGFREIASDLPSWARLEARKLLLVFSGRDLPLSYSLDLERRQTSPVLRLLPVSVPLLVALALLAPAPAFRSRPGGLLLLFLACQVAALLIFFVATRLKLPFVAGLIPFSAAGAAALPSLLRARSPRLLLSLLALAGLFLHDSRLRVSLAESTSNLAVARVASGDLPGAEAAYRQALEQNPGNAEIWFNLGVLRERQGRQDAGNAFRKALELSPRMAEAANSLASHLLRRGETTEAESLVRRALDERPDYALARFNLALALARTGRKAEALAEVERGLTLAPEPGGTDARGPARLFAGDLSAELGNLPAACAHWRAALPLLPAPEAATSRLSRAACP